MPILLENRCLFSSRFKVGLPLIWRKSLWLVVLGGALSEEGRVDPVVTHFSKFGGTSVPSFIWVKLNFSGWREEKFPYLLSISVTCRGINYMLNGLRNLWVWRWGVSILESPPISHPRWAKILVSPWGWLSPWWELLVVTVTNIPVYWHNFARVCFRILLAHSVFPEDWVSRQSVTSTWYLRSDFGYKSWPIVILDWPWQLKLRNFLLY